MLEDAAKRVTEAVEGPISDPFENKAPSSSLLGIFESKARSPVSFPRNGFQFIDSGAGKTFEFFSSRNGEERDTRSHEGGILLVDRFEARSPAAALRRSSFPPRWYFFFFPLAGCFHPTEPRGHAYEFARA